MTTAPRIDGVFFGDSEMASLMRDLDWDATPLGDVSTWPEALCTAVDICLGSRYPIVLFWGSEYTQLYNDAYRPILGTKHPHFIGKSTRECWPEIWDVVGPMIDGVLAGGQATWSEDLPLSMVRNGYVEETYFTFSYSPLRDGNRVVAVFCACQETTRQVLAVRQLDTLRNLAIDARTAQGAASDAARALARNPLDIPFSLIYVREESGDALHLLAGTNARSSNIPRGVRAEGLAERVIASGKPEIVDNLADLFDEFPASPWPEPVTSAYAVPLAGHGETGTCGVVIFGISPRRAFDDEYRQFFGLVAGQIASEFANARAYEQERKRSEQLAELDRAKTAFFSNVSHEFRTPLTLLLGPLAELAETASSRLSPEEAELLDVAQRNSRRLLRLVNTLLDFSRIEAGRAQASYEPTDIGAYTADLASMFRSAFERAGVELRIDSPAPPDPAYIDREMWEKIVMNLLSNAFKFTFEGSVTVSVCERGGRIELAVADTGTGVPDYELPRLFERFHRVDGARGRTHEGSGIGLALVQELVRLHGGDVSVTSALGEGTTFTVTIPLGAAHLPQDRIQAERTLGSTATGAEPYVEEALGWWPVRREERDDVPRLEPFTHDAVAVAPGKTDGMRIIVADDNADMRHYVTNLLSPRWTIEAVADGRAALELARSNPPDLILSDIMMPNMDGFELIRALRADPLTQGVPVVLLSARAGEESRIEGMDQGADDYLVKPFSARELIARVGARLEIARITNQGNDAVERERDNLRNVIMQSPIPMATVIGPDLVFGVVNPPYTEATGFADAAGKSLYELMPEISGQGFDELLHGVMRTGDPYTGREMLVQFRRDNDRIEDVYFTFVYAPMRNLAGVIDGVIIVASVVTEEVLARRAIAGALHEQEALNATLLRSQEALQRANAAKDEFLSMVSHELKTPITTIFGNAEILRLRSDQLDAEMRAGAIADISTESERLHRIIDNLLVLARGELGDVEVEPMLMQRLVEQLVREHRQRFPVRDIAIEDTTGGAMIDGRAVYVEQVLRNLLSNAEKYSPRDTTMIIRIAIEDDFLRVSVLDRGFGFGDDEAEKIFEPFYRSPVVATRASGIGIGLVVCKRLVESHGGHMWARLRKGGGSDIGFALPYTHPGADEDA